MVDIRDSNFQKKAIYILVIILVIIFLSIILVLIRFKKDVPENDEIQLNNSESNKIKTNLTESNYSNVQNIEEYEQRIRDQERENYYNPSA